jgi:hypothetical protein
MTSSLDEIEGVKAKVNIAQQWIENCLRQIGNEPESVSLRGSTVQPI